MKSFKRHLEEKLVIVGQGKRYGQVIFLAGGSGSGKDFAINNFIHSLDYKIFDPDAIKDPYLKWNELKNKYPQLKGKNQRNPEDASYVHEFLRDVVKLEDRMMDSFFFNLMRKPDKTTLPNIIFNRTFKSNVDFERLVPALLAAGYQKENMHLIWVLTNYKVALQANLGRDRVVPSAILVQTHSGTAETMKSMLTDKYPSKTINGDAFIILGGKENTFFIKRPKDAPKTRIPVLGAPETSVPQVVDEFQYIKVKNAGQPIKSSTAITNTIFYWIMNNAPDRDALIKYLNFEDEFTKQ